MQDFCYHTHTTFSDGTDTAEEMIKTAVALGWSEIGISDHLIVHKNFFQSPSFGFLTDRSSVNIYHDSFQGLDEYFFLCKKTIRQIAEPFPIRVYIGAEVDFFEYPEWREDFEKFKKKADLDFYITGNHFLVTDNENIIEPDDMENHISEPDEQKQLISKHFGTIKNAVESGSFDFLAHIDYMRRAKFCTDEAFKDEKRAILESMARLNIPLEISTKGIRKNGYCYPDSKILTAAAELKIPFLISDDAHSVKELGYNFAEAERELQKHHITNRWKMRQ